MTGAASLWLLLCLLPAWRMDGYFRPGGRTPTSGLEDARLLPAWRTDGSLTTKRDAIPSEGQAHWKLLKESGVFHHLRKPGRSEEGPSGGWPSGSPASPRFRESGTSGTGGVLSLLLPSRDGVTWRSPKAGRHVFTSLCSQQPLRPLKGTCDSLPDLKIFLITKKKKAAFFNILGCL